ncbi:hypothetical protein, partial [Streptomyces sp. NPDC005167]
GRVRKSSSEYSRMQMPSDVRPQRPLRWLALAIATVYDEIVTAELALVEEHRGEAERHRGYAQSSRDYAAKLRGEKA